MTQVPRTGQNAPTDTGADRTADAFGRPGTATDTTPGNNGGSASDAGSGSPWGGAGNGSSTARGSAANPSPDTPTSSTPWGSTSTTSAGSSADVSTTNLPTGANATTGSMPLVHGTLAPPAAPAQQPPPPNRSASHSDRGNRGSRPRGPRRARLQLRHIDPWTVLKFSCVLSIALFFVWLIVVGVLFGVLDASGVISKINDTVTQIQANGGEPPIRATIVFGGAAIIGVINVVLFIALSTIGAVVYNLCADLVGGIEVTLSER